MDARPPAPWWMPIPFGDHHLGIVPDLNAIVALNGAAASVWSALADGLSPELATRRLAAEHSERAAHAAEDVDACIAVWRAAGLFERPADVTAQADEPTDPDLPSAFRCMIGGAGGSAHVCVGAEDMAAIARDMLQDFPASAPAARASLITVRRSAGAYRVASDGRVRWLGRDLSEAKNALATAVLRACGGVRYAAVLHAAAVTDGNNTILLAGPGGSGKSTLAASLVGRGRRHLSEDVTPMDAAELVHPTAFAVSVKSGGVPALLPTYPPLAQASEHRIGKRRIRYLSVPASARAAVPARPTLLLVPRFDPSGKPALRPLSPLERLALFTTAESHLDFRNGGRSVIALLERLPAYEINYRNSDEAFAQIARLIPPRLSDRRMSGGKARAAPERNPRATNQ